MPSMKRVIEKTFEDSAPKRQSIPEGRDSESLSTSSVESKSIPMLVLSSENTEASTDTAGSNDSCEMDVDQGIIIEFMNITKTLNELRSLLEQRTCRDLSGYNFFLQDNQELDSSKNLVHQCVQGEGIVQINVEISHKNGVKKINIVDVLKPAEEIPLSPLIDDEDQACVLLLGDNQSHSQSNTRTTMVDSQEVTRWIVSPDFKKLQERLNIPTDPMEWNCDSVKLWIDWARTHFKLPHINVGIWKMTGKQLINMSREDFQAKLPAGCNEVFWTHVELLKKFNIVAVVDHRASASEAEVNAKIAAAKRRLPRIGPPKVSSDGCSCPGNISGNNGQIQLWQFLLELLTDKDFRDFIQWVGTEGEFKLIHPEMVAQLWGQRKNKPTMNYEKLSRALRYYYDGEMLAKVHGKRFVYKFVCDLKNLLGYNAQELNRLVTECEMKNNEEKYSQDTVFTYQGVDSNSLSQ